MVVVVVHAKFLEVRRRMNPIEVTTAAHRVNIPREKLSPGENEHRNLNHGDNLRHKNSLKLTRPEGRPSRPRSYRMCPCQFGTIFFLPTTKGSAYAGP